MKHYFDKLIYNSSITKKERVKRPNEFLHAGTAHAKGP